MVKNVTSTLIGTALLAMSGQAASISVSVNTNPTDLTNNVLGTGVSLVGSPTLQSGIDSAGTFTGGNASGLGIDTGIVLSSGSVADIDNTNSSSSTTTNINSGTDADLDSLVPQSVEDATTLSLDFTTTTGDVFFNYAFASEEYNEFVDSSFNDPFGLFLDGENIALAPNGSPVSINNVNCGSSGTGTGPNCGSFNNNDDGSFDFEFDGFTDTLTAQATGLSPGTHTLKFAVGDAGDSALDSGVFIQGSSLSSEDPVEPPSQVPAPMTALLVVGGLLGLRITRPRKRCHRD